MPTPAKLTASGRARLEHIASLKAQIPTTRQLASETGLTPLYLRQLLAKLVKRHKCDVSCET